MSHKKILLIIIIVVFMAFVLAGFLLWKYELAQKAAPTSQATPKIPVISSVDLGKDISNKIVNPPLPQTNPFSAKTNPFTGIYKNPFSK